MKVHLINAAFMVKIKSHQCGQTTVTSHTLTALLSRVDLVLIFFFFFLQLANLPPDSLDSTCWLLNWLQITVAAVGGNQRSAVCVGRVYQSMRYCSHCVLAFDVVSSCRKRRIEASVLFLILITIYRHSVPGTAVVEWYIAKKERKKESKHWNGKCVEWEWLKARGWL